MNPIIHEKHVELIKASTTRNRVYVNEIEIARSGSSGYFLSWEDIRGDAQQLHVPLSEKPSARRLIKSPPVSFLRPFIRLHYIDSQQQEHSFQVNCIPWAISIDHVNSRGASGWLLTNGCTILDPFDIQINDESYCFGMKHHETRKDVLTHFGLPDHYYCHQIYLSWNKPIFNGFYSFRVGYPIADHVSRLDFVTREGEQYRWNHHPGEQSDSPNQIQLKLGKVPQRCKVAIVMPVYDGPDETFYAIESIKSKYIDSETSLRVRFLIGLDNPNAIEMNDAIIAKFSGFSNVVILRHSVNLGFVGNCNALFRLVEEDEDVVLVNADIIAPSSDWIETMLEYAHADASIGTVTPMSNQATIFSFPMPNRPVQGLLHGYNIDDINQLLEAQQLPSARELEVPTCHGFCCLIMNSRLKLDYLFNSDFGMGYGEENDLSMRLRNQGFINIACPSVYVYHHESVSFGDVKHKLIETNTKTLLQHHPDYMMMVSGYCLDDPLQKFRNCAIIDFFMNGGQSSSCLHISHAFGGGTDKYILDYCTCQKQQNHFLLTTSVGTSQPYILSKYDREAKKFIQHESLLLTDEDIGHLFDSDHYFSSLKFATVVVHSLLLFESYGPMPIRFSAIPSSISVEYLLHDYHAFDPDYNLLDSDNNFKGITLSETVADIESFRRIQSHQLPPLHYSITEYRDRFFECIRRSNRVVSPSKAAMLAVDKALPTSILEKFVVQYHDDSTALAAKRYFNYTAFSKSKKLELLSPSSIVVAVIGNLRPNKGFFLLCDLARYIDREKLPLRIVVFGDVYDESTINGFQSVTLLGKYTEESFPRLVEEVKPNCALFLSQWPETYSYTLSLAFIHGLWPFVLSSSGAQAERVEEAGFGTVLPSTKPKEICSLIAERFRLQANTIKITAKRLTSRTDGLVAKTNDNQLFMSERADLSLKTIDRETKSIDFTQLNIAVVVHAFYPDLARQILEHLPNIPCKFDVLCSATSSGFDAVQKMLAVCSDIKKYDLRVTENRGRDMAPFIVEFGNAVEPYDLILKLHTKKSLHTAEHGSWFEHCLRQLCGSEEICKANIAALLLGNAGVVYPMENLYTSDFLGRMGSWVYNSGNFEQAEPYLHRWGIDSLTPNSFTQFPIGSMFWARPQVLAPILQEQISLSDFQEESGQTDGTFAHALERLIGVSCQKVCGLKILSAFYE
jgi:GT2 family glycosyltransferase